VIPQKELVLQGRKGGKREEKKIFKKYGMGGKRELKF